MPSEIEVFEENVRAIASRVSDIGQGLQAWNPAPEVEWGDDKFGNAMREAYYETLDDEGVSLPTAAMMMRNSLGGALVEFGEAIDGAVTELVQQELENQAALDRVDPPDA